MEKRLDPNIWVSLGREIALGGRGDGPIMQIRESRIHGGMGVAFSEYLE